MPRVSPRICPLVVVCAVEFLERLAGYLVAASLVLYLNEEHGMSASDATHLAGWLFGLSYAAAIAGGALLDWRLGPRTATLLGLIALSFALFGMVAAPAVPLWLPGALFIAGNGLFKSGIVTLLHAALPFGDPNRSAGFTWFYVAVNVGGICAPPLGAAVQSRFGWPSVALAAGLVMGCAAVVLTAGWRVLRQAPRTLQTAGPVPRQDRSPPPALLLLLLLALAVHCILFAQSTSTLLLWARDSARRQMLGWTIPPTFFAVLPPAIVLVGAPTLSVLWRMLAARGREPGDFTKIALGLAINGSAYAVMLLATPFTPGALASPLWLVACKAALTVGEMLLFPSALAVLGSLAPQHRSGVAMGLLFCAQAIGFWLGGVLGARWGLWPPVTLFAGLMAIGFGTSAVVALFGGRHNAPSRASN